MMRFMERKKPNRSGFYLWLVKNFLGMDNRFGDLAHDMAIDGRFSIQERHTTHTRTASCLVFGQPPLTEDSYDEIYDYLVYQCGACQACIDVFKESWAMYEKESAYA